MLGPPEYWRVVGLWDWPWGHRGIEWTEARALDTGTQRTARGSGSRAETREGIRRVWCRRRHEWWVNEWMDGWRNKGKPRPLNFGNPASVVLNDLLHVDGAADLALQAGLLGWPLSLLGSFFFFFFWGFAHHSAPLVWVFSCFGFPLCWCSDTSWLLFFWGCRIQWWLLFTCSETPWLRGQWMQFGWHVTHRSFGLSWLVRHLACPIGLAVGRSWFTFSASKSSCLHFTGRLGTIGWFYTVSRSILYTRFQILLC